MKIEKSEGVNESEKLLGKLCEKTFLNIWTYLNVYKKDGDELCDGMAVFENHIFLFFDRNKNTFKKSDKSLDVLWKRWKKDAIDNQIKTANYAEKYILRNKGEIFLDAKCINPFPIQIPQENLIVHKIIIAHGAADAAKKYFGSSSGSLMMSYEKKLEIEMQALETEVLPFFLQLKSEEKIHVFDSANIKLLFDELDTIFDFREYIVAKEQAIEKYCGLIYCAEEDLLAHYYRNFDITNKKHFIGSKRRNIDCVAIEEDEWLRFSQTEQYKNKKRRKHIFNFWDVCMQLAGECHLSGKALGNYSIHDNNTPLFEMAKEPRFVRTKLSEHIQNSINNFPDNLEDKTRTLKTFCLVNDLTKMYIILQFKGLNESKDEELKKELLLNICRVMAVVRPELKKIIGISIFAPKYYSNASTDMFLLNCSDWDTTQNDELLELNREFKLVNIENTNKMMKNKTTLYEFPPHLNKKKIGRNDLCHCGSGKKYKKCCL